jgi:hypothetical protein
VDWAAADPAARASTIATAVAVLDTEFPYSLLDGGEVNIG